MRGSEISEQSETDEPIWAHVRQDGPLEQALAQECWHLPRVLKWTGCSCPFVLGDSIDHWPALRRVARRLSTRAGRAITGASARTQRGAGVDAIGGDAMRQLRARSAVLHPSRSARPWPDPRPFRCMNCRPVFVAGSGSAGRRAVPAIVERSVAYPCRNTQIRRESGPEPAWN